MGERRMGERTENEAGEIGSGGRWGWWWSRRKGRVICLCSEEAALSPADIAEGSFYSAPHAKTSVQHFISVVNRTIIITLELYDPNFIGAPYEEPGQ